MTRFIIKEVSHATDSNPNFKGETVTAYYGKDQKCMKYKGTHYENDNFDHTKWMIREYGFKRECDAKRSWIYKNPENTRFWQSTVEIIKVEF